MIFDLMFFDSNCFYTNEMIDTKCHRLLTMSNQTLYRVSHSICNNFVDFIEFDDVFD